MYYGIGNKMRVSKFVHSAVAVSRQLRVINNNNINVMALHNNNMVNKIVLGVHLTIYYYT